MQVSDAHINMGWCAVTRARLTTNILHGVLAFDGAFPVLITMSPRTWAAYSMDCLGPGLTARELLQIPIVIDNDATDGEVRIYRSLDHFIVIANYAFQS